jgi:L-aminopeptidase/D-esterase-like protein
VLCGKYLGFDRSEPGGLGSALVRVGDACVAALVVANPSGDVVDAAGQVVAGARKPDGSRPTAEEALAVLARPRQLEFLRSSNTTLVAVGTNAHVSKLECRKLAEAAQMGLARRTRPSHMPSDGDTAFAFSAGDLEVPLAALVAATQDAVAEALVASVTR